MKKTVIIIIISWFASCTHVQNEKYLSGEVCKIWKPEKWDEFHYECFDKNGNGAIYKLQDGKLYHVPYIDDLVYDFNWKILNDSIIQFGNTPYKILLLNVNEYTFISPKGFILKGIDATDQFNLLRCDCENLVATKK